MSDTDCLHPNCDMPPYRGKHCCKRHWASLPDELRDEFKHVAKSDVDDLRQESVLYFEDRIIGDYEITTCRRIVDGVDVGCGADVVWMVTSRGKNVSVNADTIDAADLQYDPRKHEFHLEHCTGQQARRPA